MSMVTKYKARAQDVGIAGEFSGGIVVIIASPDEFQSILAGLISHLRRIYLSGH